MPRNSSVNMDIAINSDGWTVAAGSSQRSLQISSGNVIIQGSGSNVYTFPNVTPATLYCTSGLIVAVSDGGTGQASNTAFGVLYGSGAFPIQATAAMSSGQLLVGSMPTTRPHLLAAPAAGQYLVSSLNAIGGVAWVNTAAATQGLAKFWMSCSGGDGAINVSYNIAANSRNGVGDYTVYFSTAFATKDYVVLALPSVAAGNVGVLCDVSATSQTVSSVSVNTFKRVDGTSVDPLQLYLAGFGAQ